MSAEVMEWVITPTHLGPTWERNPDWKPGDDPFDEFVLPEITLGWQVLAWIPRNLNSIDGVDEAGRALPFDPTYEQKRFILWWYAIDENGRFIYREGILQRLKGWGKDPLAAVISAVEFVGPCRFAGWASQDSPDDDLEAGDPVAVPHPRAWVQVAAVSKEQTKNTMTLFAGLFNEACANEHSINPGKEVIYAHGGKKRIEAVTSSPRSLEGNRPTLVIKNETHHWLANNEGHAMADAIERNATKAAGGAARTLSITNAYSPHEDSVAQHEREAYEDEAAGLTIATGVMYDSLEIPRTVGLRPPKESPEDPEPTEAEIREYLAAVVSAVRGDATWLDVEGIVNSILNRKNPPSRSRRFWLNQIDANEEAWVHPDAVDASVDPIAASARIAGDDALRDGWLVMPDEKIVMFFDGSKSDDATALIGCRLSDGYVFTIGVWQKPPKARDEGWLAPREAVDARVDEAFSRFSIVAFWGDPSHALDDEDSSRYWDGMFDAWHRRYGDRLEKDFWALKSGDRLHSILWDMTSVTRTQAFVAAAETFVEEMETKDDIEQYAPQFKIDGHPALVKHLKNAVEAPGKWGTSLRKEGRESSRKIDLAVAAVGARMLRRVVLNREVAEKEEPQPGELWGAWR